MIRGIVTDVLFVYRRNWWRFALLQLLTGLALAVVLYGMLLLSTAGAGALRDSMVSDGALDPGAAVVFGLAIFAIFAFTCIPLLLIGAASAMAIGHDELSGDRPALFGSLGLGVRRVPTLFLVVVLTMGLFFVLVVAALPIAVLGILGLILTPLVRVLRASRPDLLTSWPPARRLGYWAVPFALAFRWAATGLLAFPAAVVGHGSAVAAIRAAGTAVKSRRAMVVLSVLLAWVATVVISGIAAVLGYLAGGDTGSRIGQVFPQLVLLPLTFVVMVVLYRACSGLPPRLAGPSVARIRLRAPRAAASVPTAAVVRRVAIIMPAVLVFTGLSVLSAPAAVIADPVPSMTLTVTSDADDTDAASLAAQRQNCLSGSGECTLRAALAEAAAQSGTGSTGEIGIGFSSDTTIDVTADSPLVFDNTNSDPGAPGEGGEGPIPGGPGEGGARTGTLTIDGTGHSVTIDGQNATQILSLFSRSWDVVVRGLELRNGRATSPQVGQGGGLFVGGTRSAVIEAVTFVGNVAYSGGGLYASTTVQLRNSTFSGNALAGPTSDFVTGGADLFAGGRVSAVNNTFVGSHNGAIYNWASAGYTLSLDNSLIAVTASDAQGGLDCSGGGITGTANVVAFNDTSCPGIVPSPASFLGPLARTDPGAPPVFNLFAVVGNPAIGAGLSDVGCPQTDARGVARPATGCDAGAYQIDPATLITLASARNPSPYGERVTITARVVSPREPVTIGAGTVQFQVNGADSGAPVALGTDGTANLYLNPSAAGDYSITAGYTPGASDAFAVATTAVPFVQTVTRVGTDVRLQFGAERVNLGDDVEFTIGVGEAARAVTGTVSLIDVTDGVDGAVLSDQPLSAGSITLKTSSLRAGQRLLVASYSGDASNSAGRSAPVLITVLSPSTISVQADAPSAVHGTPVTLTATVPASAGVAPTGTVYFTLGTGGTVLGGVTLDGGVAILKLDRLGAGSHTVIARYLGDDTYAQSGTADQDLTITPAPTSTILTTDQASPIGYGVPVTLTAVVGNADAQASADPVGEVSFTVQGSAGGTTTPLGSALLTDTGGRASPILGKATLTGNGDGTSTASYTTTPGQLPPGENHVSASFAPSADFVSSDAGDQQIVVVPATTAITVTSDASPAPIGRAPRLTATVHATGGSAAVPTGSVAFSAADGRLLGSAVLRDGIAVLTVSGLGIGRHEIRADYAGAAEFSGSTGGTTQEVGASTTTTTLTVERSNSVYGQPLNASVAVTGQGGDGPDGTVLISEGSVTVAVMTVTRGVASADLSALGVGTHDLTATFQASGGYLASSGDDQLTITPADTATALQLSSPETFFGDPVTLTATVSTSNRLSHVAPRGSVRFTASGTVLGTVPVTTDGGLSATATLSTRALPQSSQYPGAKLPVVAEFVPDAASPDFLPSDASGAVTVRQGRTALSLSATPGAVGSEVTVTATISVTSGSGSPSGTVRFFVGGTTMDVAVVDGEAVLTGLRLPRGSNHITAVYTSGDLNFLAGVPDGSDRTGVVVEIGQGTATVALTASAPGPVVFGSEIALTARVSGGGAIPSGSVTFTAQGPDGDVVLLGTAALNGGDGSGPLGGGLGAFVERSAPSDAQSSATGVLRTTAIPAGTQRISAVYSGDFSYGAGQSERLTQSVDPAATSTTLSASSEPSAVATEVVYSATVTTPTGAIPVGSVAFSVDGVALATATVDSAGVATARSRPAFSGTVRVVATFAPTNGNTLVSAAELAHVVAAMPTRVVLSTDSTNVAVGRPIAFVVSVAPASGSGAATDDSPTGVVTVTASNGGECTAELSMRGPAAGEMLGQCSLTFGSRGSRSVSASYGGDNLFAGGGSNIVSVTSARLAPAINFFTSQDRAWVGGETTRLLWEIGGPAADDVAVTVMRGSTAVCTSMQRAGSCDYTFPASASGPTTFTLTYAGDAAWTQATATLSQPVSGCVPALSPGVSPGGAGTVVASPSPNCASGTGYLVGTQIRYTAEPAVGYDFDHWMSGGDAVVAVAGRPVGNTAYFTVQCVAVHLAVVDRDKPGSGIRSSPSRPNCGASPRDWSSDSRGQTGLFTPGTVITLTAQPGSTSPPGPQRFYQWTGLAPGSDSLAQTTTVTVSAQKPMFIGAVFGVVCYHNVTFPTPAGGTAELGAPNCTDPDGLGYAADSLVSVSTKASGTGYFSEWQGAQILDVVSTKTGSTGSLYVSGDDLVVHANYGACVQVGVAALGELPSGAPLGSASISPAGSCPSQGAGWYATGSQVRLVAKPTNSINKFGGWSGTSPVDRPKDTTAYVNVYSSGTFTATFYSSMRCVPFTLLSMPAGALSVSAEFLHGTGTCPSGQYDMTTGTGPANSNEVTATAAPLSPQAASAQIGWSGMTKRLNRDDTSSAFPIAGSAGRTLSASVYGETTLVAWACEGLDAQLTLISPNGTRHTAPLPENSDFVNVAPTPNCGFGRATYTVGSSVFLLADGTSPGYDFMGWSGGFTGTDPYPTTPIVLDGSARSMQVVATYQVKCFTLASNFDNVAVDPAPNCPDAPAGSHSYIGGTAVTMQAIGDGDLVFRGWRGDPGTSQGDIAVTTMTEDKSIYADYTSKSVGERITDVANSVADGIAIASKKIVGVVAAVVGGLIMGGNPLTAAMGLVVLLGKAVQGVADLFGVNSDGLRAFQSVISKVSEMMTFINAMTQCATVWSAGADGSASSTGASVEQSVGTVIARQVLAEQKNAALAAARAAQQQAIAASYQSQSAAMAGTPLAAVTGTSLGQARVWAGRLGAVAAVGVGVYSMVSSGSGVQWDSSAASAWTTGADVYSTCYAQAIPPYFGLPPLPERYRQ